MHSLVVICVLYAFGDHDSSRGEWCEQEICCGDEERVNAGDLVLSTTVGVDQS